MTDQFSKSRLEFAKTVSLLLQTRGSKLRGHVLSGRHKGEGASPVDQYGIDQGSGPVDRRWAYPRFFDWWDIIDNIDLLETASDPQNPLVQACTASLGRRIDDEIIRAFFADARTGRQGGTTTSFPSGRSLNDGRRLNVAKLKEGRAMLPAGRAVEPDEEIICVVNSTQHDALVEDAKLTGTVVYSVDGILRRIGDITIVHCERLTLSGANRRVPIYAKSGMHLGIWSDVTTDIGPRRDLEGNPMEVTGSVTVGATRVDERKVVELLCEEGW